MLGNWRNQITGNTTRHRSGLGSQTFMYHISGGTSLHKAEINTMNHINKFVYERKQRLFYTAASISLAEAQVFRKDIS
jgi:hypothetical protein